MDKIANILRLLENISQNPENDLSKMPAKGKARASSVNSANTMGDALEAYILGGICSSLGSGKEPDTEGIIAYCGNQNNPPDLILTKGDAFEVKKLDGIRHGDIALNSSYPKAKLHADSTMITLHCRRCDGGKWKEKDIVYTVGHVEGTKLRLLTLVYGDCYAASRDIYERIETKVKSGIKELDLELSETKELGRINKVDPLGITNLRMRGMWAIKSPLTVFGSFFGFSPKDSFTAFALMRKTKFDSFGNAEIERLKKLKNCTISKVKIKEPNNPAISTDAVLVKLVIT